VTKGLHGFPTVKFIEKPPIPQPLQEMDGQFDYLFIYFCSFDPREGYCPQDVEHVIINIHNTMWYN
jgi:hypothetical protein